MVTSAPGEPPEWNQLLDYGDRLEQNLKVTGLRHSDPQVSQTGLGFHLATVPNVPQGFYDLEVLACLFCVMTFFKQSVVSCSVGPSPVGWVLERSHAAAPTG